MTLVNKQQNNPLKLMAAAIKTVDQIIDCACLGVQAITLPGAVYHSLLATPAATEKSLAQFILDWQAGTHTQDSPIFSST
jgi:transaldolase